MAFHIVKGNLAPDLQIVLDVNGTAEDISDASAIVMRWVKPDGTIVEERELVEDDDGGGLEAGAVKCVWEAGDTDVVGVHRAVVTVTRGNGDPQSFPSDGTAVLWEVHDEIE